MNYILKILLGLLAMISFVIDLVASFVMFTVAAISIPILFIFIVPFGGIGKFISTLNEAFRLVNTALDIYQIYDLIGLLSINVWFFSKVTKYLSLAVLAIVGAVIGLFSIIAAPLNILTFHIAHKFLKEEKEEDNEK